MPRMTRSQDSDSIDFFATSALDRQNGEAFRLCLFAFSPEVNA